MTAFGPKQPLAFAQHMSALTQSGHPDGVKAVTGHVSDKLARQYAEDYDQRRINSLTVEAWNAELRRKAAVKDQAATPEERRRKLRIVG